MTGEANAAKTAKGAEPVFAYAASLPQPQRGTAKGIDALAAKSFPDHRRQAGDASWGRSEFCFNSRDIACKVQEIEKKTCENTIQMGWHRFAPGFAKPILPNGLMSIDAVVFVDGEVLGSRRHNPSLSIRSRSCARPLEAAIRALSTSREQSCVGMRGVGRHLQHALRSEGFVDQIREKLRKEQRLRCGFP